MPRPKTRSVQVAPSRPTRARPSPAPGGAASIAPQTSSYQAALAVAGRRHSGNSLPPGFFTGLAHQRAGRLAEAARCFETLLERDPRDTRVLHLLALVRISQNQFIQGIRLLHECLAIRPRFPEALTNLGRALLLQNQPLAALAAHERALEIAPNLAEIHGNLGNTLKALGRLEEAIAAYRRALALNPALAGACSNLGNIYKVQGNLTEAVAAYQQAIVICPSCGEAWNNLGNAWHEQGRFADAETAYRRALAIAPRNADVHNNLGRTLLAQGRPAAAAMQFHEALAWRPDFAEAIANLGDAEQAEFHLDEAVAHYEHALAINPDRVETLCNLGNALTAKNQPARAIAAYRRALVGRPDSADIRYNEALAHLTLGDWPRGWENYECRWDLPSASGRRAFRQPLWAGTPTLRGHSILIHAEQGLGDTLQFIRYVPLLIQQGAEVHLEVQPSLKGLLATLPGVASVRTRGESLPDFEWHCPLLSLPRAFATTPDSIPATTPYLSAPQEKAARCRRWFAPRPHPRVGLVWAGNPLHTNDRNRSIPLSALRRLTQRTAGSFYNLQREAREGDAATLATMPEVTDLSARLGDFADTAAIVAQLDLVVTVDTAVAHLAGALAIPTWLLLPFAPDWRWLLNRTDSPWYPSFRLYRQPAPGDWDSVLARVRRDLDRWPAKPV